MTTHAQWKSLSSKFLAILVALATTSLLQAASGGVHGRVLGHDAQGKYLGVVASAQIEFQNQQGVKVGQVMSDKNGYYKVDLPPGEYQYKIVAQGYRDEAAGRGLRLTLNEGYAVFNLAVTQGENDPSTKRPALVAKEFGELRGHVWEVNEVGNQGIVGARISLRRDGTRELFHTRSRVNGDYEVTLECGTYHASIMAVGFDPLVLPEPIVIRSEIDTNQDFVLKRFTTRETAGQGIRGVVTVVDSDRTPPQIKIVIASLDNSLRPIEVRHQGSTSFSQDLIAGGYRVIASAEGLPKAESPPIYVMEGRYSQVNLALRSAPVPEPKSSVDVFVYTKSASSDKTMPVTGAAVSLQRSGADPASIQNGITDKAGHILFVVDKAGEYIAHAHLSGYRNGTGHGTVALDQKHEVGVELLKEPTQLPELKLDVQVTDSTDRRPLSGVRLLARLPSQQLSDAVRGVTDIKGHATLLLAQEGAYSVLAQLAGYEAGGESTTVKREGSNLVSIALKRISPSTVETTKTPPIDVELGRSIVSGYVAYRETTGQLRSIAETHLVWKRIAANQPAFTRLVTSNNNGRYQLELLPGHYEVRIEPPSGFERLTETVDVVPGQHDKYFILHRSTELAPPSDDKLVEVAGQVVTEISPRRFIGVPRAEVVFIRNSGVSKLTSNTDGKFSQRMPVDHYHVQVRAPGYLNIENEINVQADMPAMRLVLKRASGEPSDNQTPTAALLNLVVSERRPGVAVPTLSPVAGAQVSISQAGNMLFNGNTNALGQYSIRMKPGAYSLAISKRGYANATDEIVIAGRDITHQVVLRGVAQPGGEPLTKLTLNIHVSRRALRPSTNIRPIGDPVPGAQVLIFQGAQQISSGVTNASGNFNQLLPAGPYVIKVMAPGLAPAGKTIQLSDRETSVNIQLEGLPGGAAVIDGLNPLGVGTPSNSGKDFQGPVIPQTRYVVEYRSNSQSQWSVLGEYNSQRAAQAALFHAVERRQIPSAAPAESRIRTIAGHAGIAR